MKWSVHQVPVYVVTKKNKTNANNPSPVKTHVNADSP